MTRSDPEVKFSTDVTEVVESLRNSGFATSNADVIMFGASLAYKLGVISYAPSTKLYVRLGVLVRQPNFESYCVALMLANRHRYGHSITNESLSLEANISYLSQMANSGLMHLKETMSNFNREASALVPDLIQEALGLKTETLDASNLIEISKTIVFESNE